VFSDPKRKRLWYSVEYSSFSVGPEADFYRLNVSGFSGDVGDAITAPVHPNRIANGMRFSTPDVDNDFHSQQCMSGSTGWWFNNCARSVLNRKGDAVWNAQTDEWLKDVITARMLVKLE